MDHSAPMLANFEALPEMLTAKDLEALLQIDRKTIYSYAERGLIPYVRIESNLRFSTTKKFFSSTAARLRAKCALPSCEVAQLRYMKPRNSLQRDFSGNPMSTIS